LHARLVCAATLVWRCEPTLGFVRRRAWGAKPVATFSADAVPVGIVAAILISVKAMESWGVALEVAEGCFVILRSIPRGIHTCHTVDPRGVQVPDAMFCIIVDQRSNAVQSQVVGEYTIIIRVAVGVDACLQIGDNVGIFRGCDSAKEYIAAIP
jgi:hypothetical protein